MDITRSTLGDLFTGFKTLFDKSLHGCDSQWQKVAMMAKSTNALEKYTWLGAFPGMKKFLGEIVIKNIATSSYTIENEEFSDVIAVKQADIEQDSEGLYSPRFQALGEAAGAHPDELVFDLLSNGFSQKDYTGKNFFDSDKKHVPKDSKSGKFTNKGTAPLSHAAFSAARAGMRGLKNNEGRPFGVGRKLVLVVPPALETTGEEIVMAKLIDGGDTNTNMGKAELVVVDWLTSDTAWFLLEVGRPIKPLILQCEHEDEFTALDDPESDHVFKNHEFLYQAYARRNAGYGLPQYAFGSTGQG